MKLGVEKPKKQIRDGSRLQHIEFGSNRARNSMETGSISLTKPLTGIKSLLAESKSNLDWIWDWSAGKLAVAD